VCSRPAAPWAASPTNAARLILGIEDSPISPNLQRIGRQCDLNRLSLTIGPSHMYGHVQSHTLHKSFTLGSHASTDWNIAGDD